MSHSGPQIGSSPKITAALLSLKQIVGIQDQRRKADAHGGQFPGNITRLGAASCDIRDLEMPPLPAVLTLLRNVKGKSALKSNVLGADYDQRAHRLSLQDSVPSSPWTIS